MGEKSKGKVYKITEREVTTEPAAGFTDSIQGGGVPFERTTVEHQAGIGYPDITIWIDYASKRAFPFWELKSPGVQENLSIGILQQAIYQLVMLYACSHRFVIMD